MYKPLQHHQGVFLSLLAREWLGLSEREIEKLRKPLGVSAGRNLEERLNLPADGRSDSVVVSRGDHKWGGNGTRYFPPLRRGHHQIIRKISCGCSDGSRSWMQENADPGATGDHGRVFPALHLAPLSPTVSRSVKARGQLVLSDFSHVW